MSAWSGWFAQKCWGNGFEAAAPEQGGRRGPSLTEQPVSTRKPAIRVTFRWKFAWVEFSPRRPGRWGEVGQRASQRMRRHARRSNTSLRVVAEAIVAVGLEV